MRSKSKVSNEVNAGSMADIAFLLLIFFLVTTTILTDKGLSVTLPKPPNDGPSEPVPSRNLLKVQVNAHNLLLVGGELLPPEELTEKTKEFIANPLRSEDKPALPKKAVVSLKTDRGTQYAVYVAVMDALKAAYHELRAEHMGISLKAYLNFREDQAPPLLLQKYEAAREVYPIRISEAEPSSLE